MSRIEIIARSLVDDGILDNDTVPDSPMLDLDTIGFESHWNNGTRFVIYDDSLECSRPRPCIDRLRPSGFSFGLQR